MKRLLFLVLTIICSLLTVHAQWQPDVRLTNDPARSFTSGSNSAWCIAASANVVHVVWFDERDGNWELYYKRSTDGGVSWSADTRLTTNAAGSFSTSLTVSGSVVHVVWYDNRDGNDEIYYKRSTDGGVSWETDTRLTNNAAQSRFPSVTVSGSVVHVVWRDDRDGNREIYYKRSTDAGVSWGADTRLTNDAAFSEYPSVAVSGSVVYVVWYDNREGNDEIYYKRSTDGGESWPTIDTRLTNNDAASQFTSVTVSGSIVHVVWVDFRDGNREIYYKRSPDAGVNWGIDTRLTNNLGGSWTPSVTVSGLDVHVVWWDQRDGNAEIYYKRSTDGGVSWGTDTRLTNSPANSWNPSVAVSGSVVHVVWEDYRDGNAEIYYKRDPSGNAVTPVNRALFDYDGDGRTDVSIFRPAVGDWYVQRSRDGLFGIRFGRDTDKITPADFDGDGKTDIAVYRPSDGTWYIVKSTDGTFRFEVFGLAEDIPVPGDFDADGRSDISVFRPSSGTWFRQNSADGSFFGRQFGQNGDRPVVGDFDGDARSDLAVYRPSNGVWFQIRSQTDSFFGDQFGNPGDVVVPADYDGDRKTDLAVYRPTNGFWYIKSSTTAAFAATQFGTLADIAAPADYDGDGRADICVFRPAEGHWFRLNSSNGAFDAFPFGIPGDRPTASAFQ